MERYDTPSTPDPFDRSTRLFTTLVAGLTGPASAGLHHDELEELLDLRGREILRQLLSDHLELRARREEDTARRCPHPPSGPDGVVRTRLEYGHRRLLATLFGTVVVRRCAWRAPGISNLHPADVALSLPRLRHSHQLVRLAAIEATRGSFDAATAAIGRRCGPVIGKRQVEHAVVAAAGDIDAFYRLQIPLPCTTSTTLVMSVDGKGIVMRPDALRPATQKAAAARGTGRFRTRLASGEKPARKRMATLAVVYDAEPAVRRPHDVIAPPGGRHGNRPLRPGPRAKNKWLSGSVADDPATVIRRAFDQAEYRDAGHRRSWVVLVDGAVHQLGLIQQEAARRNAGISIVIDLVHVLEYVWSAAWCFHESGDAAVEDWVAVQALAILAGHSRRVAQTITAQADNAGLKGDRRRGADACVRYLTGKAEFLRYDRALAAGWPIATGVIEGACRHLIADRLDISGARWGLDGAEAVLKLRAVHSNSDFDTYWRFHTAREHERLYQAAGQRECHLTD
ncbi:ISKra4 family transposase [Streptomyces sp. NPDC051554]|uniref:ISKra4 family transposase n=1 Tax=Streptomyces sp. NPDC051554 TaxID=3365656 RepID=UPI0037B31981